MAGKIIADTIETGAGADISTSYVVNGSAKAWVRYNGNPYAITSSFNLSTSTDNGTGDHTFAFTSSMADANYMGGAGNDDINTSTGVKPVAYTASTIRVATTLYNSVAYDTSKCCFTVLGDLA
jgi:hypothetical protein